MFSLSNRKRGRDDDQEDCVFGNGPLSFRDHRSKQKRIENIPLPLRSTPPFPPPQPRHKFNPWTSSSVASPPHRNPDCDMDIVMDMADMQPETPSPSPTNQSSALAGRLPTPIQPTFSSQAHSLMQDPMSVDQSVVDSSAVPRSMESSDWAQTRRLPSPISEGGYGSDSFPAESPGMVLDSHFSHQLHMDHGEGFQHQRQVNMNVEQEQAHAGTTPSPPKKGHTRSRHTLNSWTCKPGMKKAFSIGYRTDCEKCRLKVPGHFNHIVVS